MRISSIVADKTYALRQLILRPGFPLDACKFPEDNDSTSAHFGCYVSEDLVGIVSIFNVSEAEKDNARDPSASHWQIRAMATHESVRRKGYAAQLLDAAEEYVRSSKGDLVWCNARTEAVGFYLKKGYLIIGEEFNISGAGPHFRMRKQI